MKTDKRSVLSIVNQMRNIQNNEEILKICKNEKDILRQCILCKYYLSSNKWSLILQESIKNKFNINKSMNNTSGDGLINGKNIEIKVSLGDSLGNFNFVQLRPSHKIDYYLFLVYNLHEPKSDLGKIYWFLTEANELYKLVPKYGGYAHGTKKINGEITLENILKNNYEYSLRPNPFSNENDKKKKLWNEMIKYIKTEREIKKILEN